MNCLKFSKLNLVIYLTVVLPIVAQANLCSNLLISTSAAELAITTDPVTNKKISLKDVLDFTLEPEGDMPSDRYYREAKTRLAQSKNPIDARTVVDFLGSILSFGLAFDGWSPALLGRFDKITESPLEKRKSGVKIGDQQIEMSLGRHFDRGVPQNPHDHSWKDSKLWRNPSLFFSTVDSRLSEKFTNNTIDKMDLILRLAAKATAPDHLLPSLKSMIAPSRQTTFGYRIPNQAFIGKILELLELSEVDLLDIEAINNKN